MPEDAPEDVPEDVPENVVARMAGFRLISALPLVVWTLFIWGTRLRNAFDDEALVGSERVQAFATAGVFLALALTVAVVLWFRRRSDVGQMDRWVVSGAAAFTMAFWLIRMVTIALGDHTLGFVLVHLVLGLGSMAVSVLALRGLVAGTDRTRAGMSI